MWNELEFVFASQIIIKKKEFVEQWTSHKKKTHLNAMEKYFKLTMSLGVKME